MQQGNIVFNQPDELKYLLCGPDIEASSDDVLCVSRGLPHSGTESKKFKKRYKGLEAARAHLYAALAASAWAGVPCPSNSELRRLSGLKREGEVTTALGVLRDKGLIAIERTAPLNGARRVAIPALGILTDWSLHGPSGNGVGRLPADGTAAMGKALGPHRRFQDIAAAEARKIVRRSPADRKPPQPPRTASPIVCPLADLPDNPEFDWR